MAKAKGIGRGNNPNSRKGIATDETVRGNRGTAKLNKLQKEELITKIIEWVLGGVAEKQLKNNVITEAPATINDNDATELIRFALARLSEITKQEAQVVVSNHVEKYEQIYTYFEGIHHAQGMAKAMKAKEKLIGLFKGKNNLVINSKKKTVINRIVEYDLNKLNPEERKKITELANKANKKK